MFSAPTWQTNFTAKYLRSGVRMPTSGYTATARGVPDIAALGGDSTGAWAIRFGRGKWTDGAGTSTSGPFIASLVAKLNAARLGKGKGTMGLLTPWLYSQVYSRAGALRDVTEGCNAANPNQIGSTTGWFAAAGWDPVTGLGTPNYRLLEELALAA
jgi:tripeptidyl-peptidase-1